MKDYIVIPLPYTMGNIHVVGTDPHTGKKKNIQLIPYELLDEWKVAWFNKDVVSKYIKEIEREVKEGETYYSFGVKFLCKDCELLSILHSEQKEKKEPNILTILTIDYIKESIQSISDGQYDSEGSHLAEDSLYFEFIESIALSDTFNVEELKEAAKLVLTTQDLTFSRWYA